MKSPVTMLSIASLAGALVGCDHTPAFAGPERHVGLLPEFPTQLTFSNAPNRLGGFTSDGSEVFYTFCEDRKVEAIPPCGTFPQPGLPSRPGDECLGILPANGGARQLEACGTAIADADSIKRFHAGTRLADGSLVFAYSTRRSTASFSVNPALYLLAPGALDTVLLTNYPPKTDDIFVPHRILSAGPRRIVTISPEVTQVVTIAEDNTATFSSVPRVDAVDAATGESVQLGTAAVHSVNLSNGEMRTLVPLPLDGDWATSLTTAIGLGGGALVVAQFRVYLVGSTTFTEGRVMVLHPDATPVEVMRAPGLEITEMAVAPDGRTAIARIGNYLHKVDLP